MLLAGDRSSFFEDIQDENLTPAQALQNWAATSVVYPHLDDSLQNSLITCLAIQLTEDEPEDLPYFLPTNS
ncbi:MAG: hypothetical protein F6K45_23795 [Kamptonema sp. SIO1D9]|nr:hypothetical protein [Kamptonema sp. SIO1D9]